MKRENATHCIFYIVVQSLSRVQLFATSWTAACQASLSLTISKSLLKLMSTELVRPSNLILCLPLLLLSSIFPSMRILSNEVSSSHQVDKVLEFQLQHQSFQWILYWFPLGWTGLISLLSKWLSRIFSSTTVWKYQFFGAQLSLWSNSHFWLTTGKTIALIIWTFVNKMISVIFNTLSRFVIVFLPRSKHVLISWLQSQSVVILEPKKIVCHYFSFSPSICHEEMELDAIILVFWMSSFKPAFPLSSFTSRGPLVTKLNMLLP